jgi:two-component system, NtrC family, sensor kinase
VNIKDDNRPHIEDELPTVLVVDDVHANLRAIEATLANLRCKVVLASSGNAALRQLLKQEFAVMLLDVQMPGMDGYEVAHHVRNHPRTSDLPLIFLTATHHDEGNVLRGYGTGAVDFLFKPIDATILRSKVSVFLDLYAKRQQVASARNALQKAYEELKATQAQLIQSAKMASLGELVAGVAHEMNNPLAFCISHIDTAARDVTHIVSKLDSGNTELIGRAERARERLRETAVGLDRMRSLVLKLRTFSRLDEGEVKMADIRECVGSVLTMLQHRLRDRIEVEARFDEPYEVECFPGLLNQAVMNLVSNAIDAIEGPGKIVISSGVRGDNYEIVVIDDGSGIPHHLRSRVIEPFFTTKPVGQGTGLGLAITFSIAVKHGGVLLLDDAEGGGTAATIRFPVTGMPA